MSTRRKNIEEFIDEIEKVSTYHYDTSDNKELNWSFDKELITKTNYHGDIEYANDAFLEATGYKVYELINKPHNIIKHPDTPRTIYEAMKISLIRSKMFCCFIKVKTKQGDYFWAEEHCELREDSNGEQTIYMKRYFVKDELIKYEIVPLFNTLRELERTHGISVGLSYLKDYLNTFSATCCGGLVENIKKKYT